MQAKQTLAEQLAVEDFHNELQMTFKSTETHNGGALKYDQNKPDFTFLSYEMMEAIASVRAFGAKKYSRDNWKKGGENWTSRNLAAAMRHIVKYNNGEQIDTESGLSHLWHAACALEHAIYNEMRK